MTDLCDFPGCIRPAICASGNVGGALVCSQHFKLTNGTPKDHLSNKDLGEMYAAMKNGQSREKIQRKGK
jgi:hypothetical protein